MITDAEINMLRANPRFLAQELRSRGIEVNVLDWVNEVLEARYGDHIELLLDIDSSIMPYAASSIAGSKSITKLMLAKAGIRVPTGRRFGSDELEEILSYCGELGFPVVIKPSLGVQGELVHLNLENKLDVEWALENIKDKRGRTEIIVEEQYWGEEYRVFFTRTGDYAVIHRDPAHVWGDGVHSITELAAIESERRMNPRINCLCPIVFDEEAERFLRRRGLTIETIPAQGEKVYVRGSSNIKMGGFAEDVTSLVHPSVLEVAERVLKAIPGLPYAGIDLMTEDISKPLHYDNYRILEVNSLPGIGMHVNPARGASRNVPGMLVDLIFPETRVAPMRLVA